MKNKTRDWAIIFMAALLSAAGYAPLNFWYLSFLGPALLLLLLSKGAAFKKGYIFGLFYSIILVHWIAFNSGAPAWMVTISMFAASAVLALNYGLIAWLFHLVYRKNKLLAYISFPFIWTSVEYIRSFGVLSSPWINLGNTQSSHLLFIQMADIGGIYLISFVMVSISTVLLLIYRRLLPLQYLLLVLSIFIILPYIYGLSRMYQPFASGNKLSVRIIQPNYDSQEKWKRKNRNQLFADMDSLSRGNGKDFTDIVLWPESATPVYIRKKNRYQAILQKMVDETGSILITGSPDYEKTENGIKPYNSLIAFEKNKGITAHYNKVHLVPFGEYIPLSNRFPILKELNLGQANFEPGKDNQIFIVNDSLKLVPAICYESIYSQAIAKAVKNGGKAIINVTNDSWFGPSWGPYQHASQAVFRAIETRRPLFRSANTGISLAIDSHGKIINKIELYKKAYIDVTVNLNDTITIYVKYADIFAIIILIGTICLIVLPYVYSRYFL